MGRAFPSMVTVVSYPEVFEPGAGRTRMNIRHNKAVKNALGRCLIFHQKYNVPKHFQWGAHTKYQYRERSERTKLIKSKHGKRYLDLVLTGKSKKKFTTKSHISYGGTTYGAGGGAVTATMKISWPPGYYDNPNAKPGAIRKRDMVDEIERWTPNERREMSHLFAKFYVEEMKKFFAAGQKVHKRFDSKLRAQGIT